MTRDYNYKISTQSIYNYINADQDNGGFLHTWLPSKGRTRRKRKNYRPNTERLKQKANIADRPSAAHNRSRFGHLEIDTIVSKSRKGGIVTIVDRKSRYLWAQLVPDLTARTVNQAIVDQLSVIKHRIKTITADNGSEFHKWKSIEQTLGCKVYFADPYSSWQRGTNERLNRDLRRYFPKRTDFSKYTEKDLQFAVNLINFKPRMCLNNRSAEALFFKREEFWQQESVLRLLLESTGKC